jgi:hypothetical protein
MNEIDKFLEKLYNIENEFDQVDEVYNFMDEKLRAGDFAICAEVFKKIDVVRITSASMISFLIITLRAKSKLSEARNFFIDRVSKIIDTSTLDKYR